MQPSSFDVSAFQLRRRSFQLALADLRVQGALILSAARNSERFATCPCCGYPTLGSNGMHDTCSVCWWEDDGQDDPDADRVAGGPNSDYSLTEARENFARHQTQYRSSDKRFRVCAKAAAERARVVAAYDALLPNVHPWSFVSALPRIDELYDALREREFGRRRVRRWRAAAGNERRRADREWEIWTTLAQGRFPRSWSFLAPPSVFAHRARTFKAFVARVGAGIEKRLGRDALAPARGGHNYARWSSGERDVWLTHLESDARVHLMFEPYVEERVDRYAALDDAGAVDEVVRRISEYFEENAVSA